MLKTNAQLGIVARVCLCLSHKVSLILCLFKMVLKVCVLGMLAAECVSAVLKPLGGNLDVTS